jgi:glycosyltransferase involved in cell wall biosynthesis
MPSVLISRTGVALNNNLSRSYSILRLLLQIRETSAPYNQLSLAWPDHQNITICTYFKSQIRHSQEIRVFEGDGTLRGFFRGLRAALKHKEYDVIHVHAPHLGLLFLIANILPHRGRLRTAVYTVHNSYRSYKWRHRIMLIPIFAFFQRVVFCGQACFESFPHRFRWLARGRICAVQNGIDLARVDRVLGVDARCGSKGNFTIAVVGRLIPIKNSLSVLLAFQQSDDQSDHLLFIGEGHLRDSLLAKSRQMSLDGRVGFTGLIPRNQVYEHLSRVDLFISASRGEGLPISVLEAMACRCPVLLSDIPPHRELAHGTDFIPLVPPDDIAAFAREIKRFREMPSSERVEIGEKCRNLVEGRFSLTAMHRRYEEVYADVLSPDPKEIVRGPRP